MRTLLLAALAAALAGCSGKPEDNKPEDNKPTPADTAVKDRDRDYLAILENDLEGVAVHQAWVYWDENTGAPFINGYSAAGVISKRAKQETSAADARSLALRQQFVAKHGIDRKDWDAEFTKRHPERRLLVGETTQAARLLAGNQLVQATGHLGKKAEEFAKGATKAELEKRLGEYRDAYFQNEAPKLLEQAKAEAKKVRSLQQIRQRVSGQ